MQFYRFIGVALAAAVLLAGRPLAGGSEQGPAAPADGASPFDSLHFRPIGPASMSGRITDLAVSEANPALYYVATAHGGVWKTTNNGTTFEAIFQDQGPLSIGDVTISQSNPDLLWVGSGESSNRQSVSWGDGVYKSTDGGKTFTHMGLRASKAINRIVIDPRDNNVVFVAVTGSLWGPGERARHLQDDRRRQDLEADAEGGRRHRRERGGDGSLEQPDPLRDDVSAPPDAVLLQRRRDRQRHLQVDRRRRDLDEVEGRRARRSARPHRDRRVPQALEHSVCAHRGPDAARRRAGRTGRRRGRRAKRDRRAAAAAAPAAAQECPGGGRGGGGALNNSPTGMYRSDDAGATWRKVNNANPRPMYFSQIDIDPTDPDVVYLGGVGLHQTLDGGKTIATDVAEPIHDDVHAIWINPANPLHVLIGNDGGLAVSYDRAQDVGVPAQPAGRALLPRQLRHGDSVQRLRRDAGQLQLVRPERGARRRRHRQLSLEHAAGRRRVRRPPGSDRLSHRLQRIAGRQHRPRRSRDRRDDERAAAAGAGRAGAALALGYAAPAVAARSEGGLRRGQQGVPIARSRTLVGRRSAPT